MFLRVILLCSLPENSFTWGNHNKIIQVCASAQLLVQWNAKPFWDVQILNKRLIKFAKIVENIYNNNLQSAFCKKTYKSKLISAQTQTKFFDKSVFRSAKASTWIHLSWSCHNRHGLNTKKPFFAQLSWQICNSFFCYGVGVNSNFVDTNITILK